MRARKAFKANERGFEMQAGHWREYFEGGQIKSEIQRLVLASELYLK